MKKKLMLTCVFMLFSISIKSFERCNRDEEISQFEYENKAHEEGFKKFVVGLKAMGKEDRDKVLELLDKHNFDTSLSISQRLELYDQVDDILHRNKIFRSAGMRLVKFILEEEKSK